MKSMMGLFVAALVAVVGGSGCQSQCASTGWRFEVGRPATLTVPAALSQGSGSLAVTSMSSGSGLAMAPAPLGMAAGVNPCLQPAPQTNTGGATLAFGSAPCTLDDICRRLDRIEQRCQPCPPEKLARPMPQP